MIVILGATGNVGGKITAMLAEKNVQLRVISRSLDHFRSLAGKKVVPFVGDIGNTEFLSRAFAGADTVFTMIPPNPKVPDFLRYADMIGDSIARALVIAGVKHVVNLSSVGADLADAGTGPIKGLHRMEERLNRIKGLNVVHLRAGYFMENLLMNIDLIRSKGVAGSAVRGDIRIPMIATKDIAAFAAERLLKRDFIGSSVRYLLGEGDLTLTEAAGVIGSRIAKPGLPYIAFPYEDAEKGMVAAGLSPDMSRTYIEMAHAFNEGRITAPERSVLNTTPTSIEAFSNEVFAPAYTHKAAA